MITWETRQGGIISPTLFKIVVDDVAQKFLAIMVKDQAVAQAGLYLNVRR